MRQARLIFILFFAAYTAAGVLFITQYDRNRDLSALCCGTGPLVKNLVRSGSYTQCAVIPDRALCLRAARMPVIPLSAAALAALYERWWFVALVKDSLITIPIGLVAWLAFNRLTAINRRLTVTLGLFALTFPGVVVNHFDLGPEESVLIGLAAFAFGYLPLARRDPLEWRWLILAAALNAALFLTTSSTALPAISLCTAYFFLTQNTKVLLLFGGLLGLSMFGWGLFTLAQTGRFSLGTSLDGFTLSKGNNEYTLHLYDSGDNLDSLDDWLWKLPASEGRPAGNEWAYDDYFTRRALTYARNNPLDELQLLQVRASRFYLGIRSTIGGQLPRPASDVLGWFSTLYLLIFRVMLWGCLIYSLIPIGLLGPRAIRRGSQPVLVPAAYLAFVLLYSVPYLAGVVTWERVLPLVIPTVVYCLWALNLHEFHLPSLA